MAFEGATIETPAISASAAHAKRHRRATRRVRASTLAVETAPDARNAFCQTL